MRYRLSDVNPTRISLCKKGANGKRFFLRKEHGDDAADAADIERALIVKADWSAVYCVVAEPGAVENGGLLAPTDEDVWDDHEEIRKACHRFARNGGAINLNHGEALGGTMVENAIAHADFTVQSPDGELHTIRKGSWYIAIEPDDQLRDSIEKGQITGVSLEGDGLRVPLEKAKLKQAERDKLPASAFAFPSTREYPIHDQEHAQKALQLGAQHESGKRLQTIRQKVKRKYPNIDVSMKKQDGTITTSSMGGNGTVGPSIVCPKCKRKVPAAKSSCPNCGRDVSKLKQAFARNKKASVKKGNPDHSPDNPIPDKPGVNNWIDKYGPDLPPYYKEVAEDIHAQPGKDVGHSIQLATGIIKNWAHGLGNVTAKTRAKAQAALKQYEAMQAKAAAAHAAKLAKLAKAADDLDPWVLAGEQARLEKMDRADRSLLARIAQAVGIEKAEGAEDENVPTFEDIIVARELNDELPDAFDALQQAIYMALSPNAGGDPVAIIQESLDEFGTWASSLVQRLQGGDAGAKESLAKELARLNGEDTDTMTDEQFAELKKATEESGSATKELVGLIREMVERQDKRLSAASGDGDGDGEGGKQPVQKSEDELRSELTKAIEAYEKQGTELQALAKSVEKLAEGRSSQREPVAKSNGSAWGGTGIMFGD